MYNLIENKIFKAVNNNETVTVNPEKLNFCMRIPLTEGKRLTVKDYVITIFLNANQKESIPCFIFSTHYQQCFCQTTL